ncbi:FKBP-type peptidyl-prolyl cis-trans isomerase [Gracilimonas mengyeensis]|nr:FKBP-type peptidyl-prolyl cis-trans isomerase [Gracilimonas mengyeensis]
MKFISKSTFLVFLLISAISVSSCDDDNPYEIDLSAVPKPFDISNAISSDTTDDGLIIHIIEEGSGQYEVDIRDEIDLYYTGRYLETMEVIVLSRSPQTSYINGNTTPSNIPSIPNSRFAIFDGLVEGIVGMKEGEKRVLIIPPELGLGVDEDGNGDTARYDLELDEIVL